MHFRATKAFQFKSCLLSRNFFLSGVKIAMLWNHCGVDRSLPGTSLLHRVVMRFLTRATVKWPILAPIVVMHQAEVTE